MMIFKKNLTKYKHDTVGMFEDISFVVSKLEQVSFGHPESLELFNMVHDEILKMVSTSKEVIRQSYEQQMILMVVDAIDDSLKGIQIDGLNLRLDYKENSIIYYYPVKENKEDLLIACGKLLALLPLKEVTVELSDKFKQAEIASLCRQSLESANFEEGYFNE